MLAASMLTSCDNLKKKDAKTDDDEETTTKKKKKALDDEETTDDQTTKKKKTTDDEDIPVKKKTEENTDEDYTKKKTTTDYNTGWGDADKTEFMRTCTEKATVNLGSEKLAKNYCSCMLEKIEAAYPDSKDANKMSQTEMKSMAADCNQQ